MKRFDFTEPEIMTEADGAGSGCSGSGEQINADDSCISGMQPELTLKDVIDLDAERRKFEKSAGQNDEEIFFMEEELKRQADEAAFILKEEQARKDRESDRMTEDDIARIAVDEDFLMEGDSADMSSHMRHWAYLTFVLGIVFEFVHYKRADVMSLEDSRMTLIGSVVLIACSVLFLIADRARSGKPKK